MPTAEGVALLQQAERWLRALDVDPALLGNGDGGDFTDLQKQYPQRWNAQLEGRFLARWRPDGSPYRTAIIEFVNREFAGLRLNLKNYTNLISRPALTVPGHPSGKPLAIFNEKLVVNFGPRNATEAEALSALSNCWLRLNQKLQDAPLRKLLVQDNLGQPHTVAGALRQIAPGAVYLSILWSNPPSPFPADRIERSATNRRGINMVAITGDVQVQAAHAPLLQIDPNKERSLESMRANALALKPSLLDFLSNLGLHGPRVANAVFAFPDSSISKAKIAVLPVNWVDGISLESPSQFLAAIEGEFRANTPVAVVITGNLPVEETLPNLPPAIPRLVTRPLVGILAFHESPLEHTYRHLSQTGLRILQNAKTVEVFRLALPSDEKVAPTAASEFQGFEAWQIGRRLGARNAKALADILLSEGSGVMLLKNCINEPGYGFRLATREGSIAMDVSFTCDDLTWTVRDANGKALTHGFLDLDEAKLKTFRQTVSAATR